MTDKEKALIDGQNIAAAVRAWNRSLLVAGLDNSGMDEMYSLLKRIIERLEDAQ